MTGIINSIMDEWILNVLEPNYVKTGNALDIADALSTLTCDIILQVAFDCRLTEKECDEITKNLTTAYSEFSHQRNKVNPLRQFWATGWMFAEVREARRAIAKLHQIARGLLQAHRAKKNPNENIVLDMIDKNPYYINDEERIRDLLFFFIAGFDTTAASLSWAFLELARHTDEQTKLRNALNTCTSEDAKLNNESLKRVIRETLRLYPAAALGSVRVVGTDVMVPAWNHRGPWNRSMVHDDYSKKLYRICLTSYDVIHRNASYFPNPDEFVPSRWEKPSEDMLQSFLPFACGRRNCLGQAFANAEMTVFLARLFEKYEFSVVDEGRGVLNVILKSVGIQC